MRNILFILGAFVLAALYSCGAGAQQAVSESAADAAITAEAAVADENNTGFDLSQFYREGMSEDGIDKYIYNAHRSVPKGGKVTLKDLDSLFGKPFVVNVRKQTKDDWSLYEQENGVFEYFPTEPGDTLVMMRRIYGRQGDWMVWVNLELKDSEPKDTDPLRVINFLAYDNSKIQI